MCPTFSLSTKFIVPIWRSHRTTSTRSESMVIGGADKGNDGDGHRDEVPDGVAFVGVAKSSQGRAMARSRAKRFLSGRTGGGSIGRSEGEISLARTSVVPASFGSSSCEPKPCAAKRASKSRAWRGCAVGVCRTRWVTADIAFSSTHHRLVPDRRKQAARILDDCLCRRGPRPKSRLDNNEVHARCIETRDGLRHVEQHRYTA